MVASGPATTSLVGRTGEWIVVPVLTAQRLGMAAEQAWRRSGETDVAEEEEERREQMDLVGRGGGFGQF